MGLSPSCKIPTHAYNTSRKRSAPYAQKARRVELGSGNSQGAHVLSGPNLDVGCALRVVAGRLTCSHQGATNSTRCSFALGGSPVQHRDSNERTRAARRLEDFARRDGSNRVAALSDGRAEAASRRKSRHSCSARFLQEDASDARLGSARGPICHSTLFTELVCQKFERIDYLPNTKKSSHVFR